jgi:hypothetical protein
MVKVMVFQHVPAQAASAFAITVKKRGLDGLFFCA